MYAEFTKCSSDLLKLECGNGNYLGDELKYCLQVTLVCLKASVCQLGKCVVM